MSKEIGGYYMYNLYDDCWYENDLMRAANAKKLKNFHTNINEQSYFGPPPLTGASANEGFSTSHTYRSKTGQDGFTGGLNDYPCGGPHALNVWVNASAVRKALHVTADAFFFSGIDFDHLLIGTPTNQHDQHVSRVHINTDQSLQMVVCGSCDSQSCR